MVLTSNDSSLLLQGCFSSSAKGLLRFSDGEFPFSHKLLKHFHTSRAQVHPIAYFFHVRTHENPILVLVGMFFAE